MVVIFLEVKLGLLMVGSVIRYIELQRGYIKEFIYKVPTIENPTDYEERIMYVNIPLKIKSR